MSDKGLATAPKVEITAAPKKMYQEIEQEEEVSRGYVKVMEIIAYDVVGKKKNEDGKEIVIERGRKPYFCQNREDITVFLENNPGARIETFGIQLLKSAAIKYLDDPENMKQFEGRDN